MSLLPTKKQWKAWSLPSKLTAIGVLIGVLSLAFWGLDKLASIYNSYKSSYSPTANRANNYVDKPVRNLSYDPNTQRTPIYARTQARVSQRTELLIKNKVDPWLMMRSGKMATITLHNGRTCSYRGIEYEGSPAIIFWESLIDPFLKESIQEVFDEVGIECRANGIDASLPLDEAAMLLRGMVHRVYGRMVEVDQKLRRKRGGEMPPKKDVTYKIERIKKFAKEQLGAAKALYSRNTK